MNLRWIPGFLLLAACATGVTPAEIDAALPDGAVRLDAAPDSQIVILPDGGPPPIDAAPPIDGAMQQVDAAPGSCVTGASVLINEVVPSISGGADLIELRVVTAGSLLNLKLHEGPTTASVGTLLATLPAINAQPGDIVVVHLQPSAGPAPGNGPASETSSKTQYPTATYSANYDSAWDVIGGTTGVTATDVVITLRAADSSIIDAAVLSNRDGSSSATYTNALAAVQAVGAWLPAQCSGAACTDSSNPNAQSLGADYSTVGTSVTGLTVQRTGACDTNTAADFTVKTSTLGAPN